MGSTPLIFANQAIRKFVNNHFSDKVLVLPDDYRAMRVVFRKKGGTWEGVVSGDVQQIRLLSNIVKAWGKLKQDQRKVEIR